MSLDKVNAIDVSRWQPNINWSCVAEQGIIFAALRASVSNYYTDPSYVLNAEGASRYGIIHPPYHVTRPDKLINGKDNSPKAQMDYFANVIEGHHDGVVVLDVELANVYGKTDVFHSKSLVTDVNMTCWEIAKTRYDQVYFYTRFSFIKDYMLSGISSYSDLDIWAAYYGKDDGKRYPLTKSQILPGFSINQVVIHQYTSKGVGFCFNGPALDYNYIMNQERFNEIHKINPDEDPILVPGETEIKALEEQLRVLTLRIGEVENRLNNAKLVL